MPLAHERSTSVTAEQHDRPVKVARHRTRTVNSVASLPPIIMNRIANRDGKEKEAGVHNSGQSHVASGNSISRSLSRYRRRANSLAVNQNHNTSTAQASNSDPCAGTDPPPVPAIPRTLRSGNISQKNNVIEPPRDDNDLPQPGTPRADPRREHALPPESHQNYHHRNRPSVTKETRETQVREIDNRGGRLEKRRVPSGPDTTGGADMLTKQVTRSDAGSERERERDGERELERRLAEQKKKDLERLEAQLAKSQGFVGQSQKSRSPIVDKFAFLTKSRKNNKDSSSPGLSPSSSTTDSFEPMSNRYETPKAAPAAYIQPGGKGIVPQTDAPNSAINGAGREVIVRCRHHTFNLEVTPETTPADVLFQTSNRMTHDLEIGPSSCVVVEAYDFLGLERRLRTYERIRDVMNSWDRDGQNQLVVTVSDPEKNQDLDIHTVPKSNENPPGFQLYMYHSNRQGKWNKRWITLLENGQVMSSKKQNAKATDKDSSHLCRMSDYDIYAPTESQMRRHLKPPKRYCFAVKSQQKTTIFLNTENYVQYFCTEDPSVAAEFKEKAHAWRSWYLVDRRPEGRKQSQPQPQPQQQTQRKFSVPQTEEKKPQANSPPGKHSPAKSINVAALDGHRLRVSVDESPYTIGQFEPLLDMKRFDKRLSQFGRDFLPPEMPDVSKMPKGRDVEHTSPKRVPKENNKTGLIDTISSINNDAFTGNGLLGEGYEERRAVDNNKSTGEKAFTGNGLLGEGYQARKVDAEKSTDTSIRGRKNLREEQAFTDGPSLLNKQAGYTPPEIPDQKPESPSWFPSALQHTAQQRSSSSSRPSTSAGIVHTRRPSISGSRPPLPPLSGARSGRPQTQVRPSSSHHEHPHRKNPHAHPNPLGSAPPMGNGGLFSSSNKSDRPKPLLDIQPTAVQQPPQWNRDKKGHGVKVAEGMSHLVDLISVGNGPNNTNNGFLEVPSRSALRRPPPVQSPPASSGPLISRAGSKSAGTSRVVSSSEAVPPVPSLSARHENRDRDQGKEREKQRIRERERGREREYRERAAAYNAVPGRAGTLKAV